MSNDVLMIVDIIASLVVKNLMGGEDDKGEEQSSPSPFQSAHHFMSIYYNYENELKE